MGFPGLQEPPWGFPHNHPFETIFIQFVAVNGAWGMWTAWSCSVTCGTGTNSRLRACDSPPVSNGGDECQGSGTDTSPCNLAACPGTISFCMILKLSQKNCDFHQDANIQIKYIWWTIEPMNACINHVAFHWHFLNSSVALSFPSWWTKHHYL